MLAVNERVMGDLGVFDLEVTVGFGVLDTEHEADGGAVFVTGEVFEVIAGDNVIFANDANAARRIGTFAEEDVVLDTATVAMAQRQ